MLNLVSKIIIGDINYSGLVECEMESSWDTITDTCVISLPKRIGYKGRNISRGNNPLITVGMPVKVYLGYNGNLIERFRGYVRSISAEVPLIIECEDEAYKLKKGEITKSYKETTLKMLLKDVMSEVLIGAQPDNVGLGSFRISKATPAKVLEHLKSEYFLRFWFREGKLYAGLAYWPHLRINHKLNYEVNIIDNDLKFRNEDDIRIKLKIINITLSNQKQEYEYGDSDGDVRTVHLYNRKKPDIDLIAKEELSKMKYTGYIGTFTTFGIPVINHNDSVELISDEYPERNGTYLVKTSHVTFGKGGYRQNIELDIKIS